MPALRVQFEYPQDRAQRTAYVLGAALVASGVFHVFVWLLDGGSLAGAVSWRKPILFGLSAGVTVLSMAWVKGQLRCRSIDAFLLTGFAVALVVEVGLITLQQWRGTASHYNRSTPFDANVLLVLEVLVIFATCVIAWFTWRSFCALRGAADLVVAIRGGLVLLLLSCLIGMVIVAIGNRQQLLGLPVEQFGERGVLKFPHGIPMHAIQALPLLAWGLSRMGCDETLRRQVVGRVLVAIGLLTLFSLIQTFSGRARFEFWWPSWLVLLGALLALVAPSWGALRWVASRWTKAKPVRGW